MSRRHRRHRRHRRPETLGPPRGASALLAAAVLLLLLAACAAPTPWGRGSGSAGPFQKAQPAEYEVDCTKCRVSYSVPDGGRRNEVVTDSWRQTVMAEPGGILSIDVTVTEVVAIRAASVQIRVRDRVVDADTLWRSSDRRTISASHTVRGGTVDPLTP